MASLRNNLNTQEAHKEIRKLTAIALSLLIGLTALTQFMDFEAKAADGSGLSATYFDNLDLTSPKINRQDDNIDFDWDYGSPDPSMGQEEYSVRWTGSVEPRYSDTYNFYTFSDDGVRLWVDGELIVDNWTDHPRVENIGTIKLEAGKKYSIKLEYYERSGRAILQLSWSSARQSKQIIPESRLYPSMPEILSAQIEVPAITAITTSSATNTITPSTSTATTAKTQESSTAGPSVSSIRAELFDDNNLMTWKKNTEVSQINNSWGGGSPDPMIEPDTFSVRWIGKITPSQSGTYAFYTNTDDGVKVFINGQNIISNWADHSATEDTGQISLSAGSTYELKMEYYERYGSAAASLFWSGPGVSKQILRSKISVASEPTTAQPTTTAAPSQPSSTETVQAATIEKQPATTTTTQSLGSADLYVNPYSQAANWVNSNRGSGLAPLIEKIAQQATAQWLGGWNSNIYDDVKKTVDAASAKGKTAVFVAYNIPQRDCGSHSAGGVGSYGAYSSWIGAIASAIGNGKAIVILEPDALSLMNCLSAQDKDNRMNALRDAVGILKRNGNTAVYIDAGHPGWISADEMAGKLHRSGISQANGFALNTSNFITTSDNINYGKSLSEKVGGKKFVIDTSRNGSGPAHDSQWCNPQGRSLGQKPTTSTGNSLVDAYLWVKAPGESDGNCNGGPSAGTFWADYAADLARRSGW
jgi:endoglucanase